jgi:hypothetical protein
MRANNYKMCLAAVWLLVAMAGSPVARPAEKP